MTRTLSFLGIGAQKAGTTALHLLLQQHPHIWLPGEKEAPFFTVPERRNAGLSAFMQETFGDAPAGAVLGKVTPQYMMGNPTVPPGRVPGLVRCELACVRLIALLRDPIERAWSQWRMSVRRGRENRSFNAAVEEELEPDRLQEGRDAPDETNSYLSQGEYARLLEPWVNEFGREALWVELSDELWFDHQGVGERIARHIGVRPHQFKAVGRIHGSGERQRVSTKEAQEFFSLLRRNVFGEDRNAERRAVQYWFNQWNTIPGERSLELDSTLRWELVELFSRDAAMLSKMGITVPWRKASRWGPQQQRQE